VAAAVLGKQFGQVLIKFFDNLVADTMATGGTCLLPAAHKKNAAIICRVLWR
jgi:hypothetical protein